MAGTRRFERAGRPSGARALDWPGIERSAEFQELVHERRRFLRPATTVFLVGAIGYLILVAFVPGVMLAGRRRAAVRVDRRVVHGAAHLGADVGLPA